MTLIPEVQDLYDQITFNQKLISNITGTYANQNLSNLTNPTSINQDLIPNGNKNFGDINNRWTIYTNGITNGTLTSPFLLDFERDNNYPFIRYRRSDFLRGFAIATSGIGMYVYVCQDLIFVKQPSTEYSNIGLNTVNDVGLFGFNSYNNVIFTSNSKVVFNPSSGFSVNNTTAQVHFRTLNNNNMDSYFLVQCSSSNAYRGGFLFSTTASNTSGNTSVKVSAGGTGNHAKILLANVQNNSPDNINAKLFESFGDSGSYTFGRNIALGDSTNKGVFLFWIDSSSFNSNMGNGVIHWGNASTVPSGNPASNTIYEYVESGYKKIRDPNGFVVTL